MNEFIDIRKAFKDGETYAVYRQYVMGQKYDDKPTYAKYKEELNKDFILGDVKVNLKLDTLYGFSGDIGIDTSKVVAVTSNGTGIEYDKVRKFVVHPHEFIIRTALPSDNDFTKDFMVGTGMVTEDEWVTHKVKPANPYVFIKSIDKTTLMVELVMWVTIMPYDLHDPNWVNGYPYEVRTVKIPLSEILSSTYMKIIRTNLNTKYEEEFFKFDKEKKE